MAKSQKFHELPAIKGIQAGRIYYAVSCPLKMVPELFAYIDESLPPEIRIQRVLNKQRIPEMKEYMLKNKDSYVFSALTASVDGGLQFKAFKNTNIGILAIDSNARILINDGQHRRAAIEAALLECPEIGEEDIFIVIYQDAGLKNSQQMFSDLNRYAIRPTKSLNILYDNRDSFSMLIKECILAIPMFNGSTENEKSSISNRSKALFTLSGIYHATKFLLKGNIVAEENMQSTIIQFWNGVSDNMLIWQKAKRRELSGEVFRKEYICGHAITLKALGDIGNIIMRKEKSIDDWHIHLAFLKDIDWRKENPDLQGKVVTKGKISTSLSNQREFAQYLMSKAGQIS